MYKIGNSKVEITFFKENCGMLGYGRHFHYMRGIETLQYVRATVFQHDGRKVALVCGEIGFCTDYLKYGVIEQLQTLHPELGFEDANVMLTAQHTHSTAGGFNQYLIYNITVPGFQRDVYEHYRDGIVRAIVQADQNAEPAEIRRFAGDFDPEAEIAFNRSLEAYNRNPEVREKLPYKKRHLASDRTMKLLRFESPDGRLLGTWNWFGVHTTSVSNRRDKVCYDNKGYAADFLEKYLAETHQSPLVATFAQDATGDISPNFIWNWRHQEYRGKHEDDYESAAYNGQLQCDQARALLEQPREQGELIRPEIDYVQMYVDMTKVDIEESFTGGLKHESTADAAFGMAFLAGTTDGQGAPKVVSAISKFFLRSAHQVEVLAARLQRNPRRREAILRFHNAQHPKAIAMNLSKGIVAGAREPEKLIIPDFIDPVIKYLKHVARIKKGTRTPWVPERLPLQLIILGQIAFVGIPAEITTIAAERLRQTILEVLKARGVSHIQLCPYANSYAGYITTYEEYRVQAYEGGHTLFGKWTLAAYQMKFRDLARFLLEAPDQRTIPDQDPQIFAPEEI